MKRLVIGILAHVDAGKTTLSEALLYTSGAIRKLGRVDHGDAALDTDALERARGITIDAKQAVLTAANTQFTLVDTPGHVDFSAEAERALQVLDYAVLVLSGPAGVQSHTETLWRLLRRYRVPVFVFVNKMDLPGADRTLILQQLTARFGAGFVDFTGAPAALAAPARAEELALCGEALMNEVLAHGAPKTATVAAAVARRAVFPCWFGSALRLEGVKELLAGLDAYTCQPPAGEAFGAQVFKIAEDAQGKRLTFLKVTGGVLRVKDTVTGRTAAGEAWSEKVNELRVYAGAKFTAAESALPGTVCAAAGLARTLPGDGLGAQAPAPAPLLAPVLRYTVQLPAGTDAHTALVQLRRLEEEDPQLHVAWDARLGAICMQLMGQVQLEVLQSRIAQRFGLQVTFGQGAILYRETLSGPVTGAGHYEPLRHYAEVQLLLEPGARGSGLAFASACREEVLDKNWQRLVLTHLQEKTHLGVLAGAPLTDVKITLLAGRAHVKHTEGGDFREATYRAVRCALEEARREGKAVLLEPWYAFRLQVPAASVGRAMADLERLCAETQPPETQGGTAVLTGRAPVATLQEYAAQVAAYTRGEGVLTCENAGSAPCHNTDAVLAAVGYDSARDTENPADSIFCAHGAGSAVPWREAYARMHTDSGYAPDGTRTHRADTAQSAEPARRCAAEYRGTLAQDKELLAIFERTYGPVHAHAQEVLHTPRAEFPAAPRPAAPAAVLPSEAGPEYLLVDGYNMLFAWDDLAALARENLEAARRELMDILCNYTGYRRCETILVFDAYKVKGGQGEVEPYHNITVVYTKEAETADMYIEKATHALAKQRLVRVATSDGAEQLIILGHGALRVPARLFRQEVDAAYEAIRAVLDAH